MNEPSPAPLANAAAADLPDPSARSANVGSAYLGAIGAAVAALLVIAFGVAVPLQVIPPKKEEAVAMVAPPRVEPKRPPEFGVASWYGDHEAGLRTASGAVFRPEALTAAHRWLPLGTKVKVTRLGTQHSTVVTINDRGPYVGGRLIDLSPAAARQLAMIEKGLVRVRVDVLEVPHRTPQATAKRAKKHAHPKTEQLATQPAPTPIPPEAAKPTPAEAAQQTKPVDAKPVDEKRGSAAEPDSLNHFP